MPRTVHLLVYLLLGALANTGVSLVLAMYADPPRQGVDDRYMSHAEVSAIIREYVDRWPDDTREDVRSFLARSQHAREYGMTRHSPGRTHVQATLTVSEIPAAVQVLEAQYGWPLPAMRSTGLWFANANRPIKTAVLTGYLIRTDVTSLGITSQRIIPIGPTWPGFLVNSVLYAAALWLLMLALGMTRRMLRRLRGRCRHCGYQLRGLTRCPECGDGHGPAVADDAAP